MLVRLCHQALLIAAFAINDAHDRMLHGPTSYYGRVIPSDCPRRARPPATMSDRASIIGACRDGLAVTKNRIQHGRLR